MAEISRLPRPFAALWEWQHSGACQTLPSEMFFHPDGERGPSRRNRDNAAKVICSTCPVIQECRDHALSVQEPFGIWGGLSEEERAVIIARKVGEIIPTAS
jgi:WhiB family redox-sensing transcriptional regulator